MDNLLLTIFSSNIPTSQNILQDHQTGEAYTSVVKRFYTLGLMFPCFDMRSNTCNTFSTKVLPKEGDTWRQILEK